MSCKEKKIETGTLAIETEGVDGNTAIARMYSRVPRTTIEGNLCDKGLRFQRNSGAASVGSITR